MRKKSAPKTVIPEKKKVVVYPDCLQCRRHIFIPNGLINCQNIGPPHPNCIEWKVSCINFKIKNMIIVKNPKNEIKNFNLEEFQDFLVKCSESKALIDASNKLGIPLKFNHNGSTILNSFFIISYLKKMMYEITIDLD